ncbi:hypothetical protein NSE01_03950 [Novosphingobium sediminis]|uniref:Uncharacterized protein n=1 Tax=Novosphingobium sediminis TaxID=707214 RepID=A0A512AFY6_9SPHN|nr:hypothetical protein NSE01_03950 [Novosphingobium sediminis]
MSAWIICPIFSSSVIAAIMRAMRRSVAGLVIVAGLCAAGQSAGCAVLELSAGAARTLPEASNMAAKSARRTIILTLPVFLL